MFFSELMNRTELFMMILGQFCCDLSGVSLLCLLDLDFTIQNNLSIEVRSFHGLPLLKWEWL